MKILLIETSRTYHEKSKGVRLSLPLGLLYMGAVLIEEGFEVSLFNSLVCPKTRVKKIPGFLHHGVDDDYFKDKDIKIRQFPFAGRPCYIIKE